MSPEIQQAGQWAVWAFECAFALLLAWAVLVKPFLDWRRTWGEQWACQRLARQQALGVRERLTGAEISERRER